MEETNLIKALEAYIEEEAYKNEYGDQLPMTEQYYKVKMAMQLLYELKF